MMIYWLIIFVYGILEIPKVWFFTVFLEPRRKYLHYILFMAVPMIHTALGFSFTGPVFETGAVRSGISCVIAMVMMHFLFEGRFLKKLAIFASTLALQLFIEILEVGILDLVNPEAKAVMTAAAPGLARDHMHYMVIMQIVMLVLESAILVLIVIVSKNRTFSVSNRAVRVFGVIPVTMATLFVMLYFYGFFTFSTKEILLYLILMIIAVALAAMMFKGVVDVDKKIRAEERTRLYEEAIAGERKQYESMIKAEDEMSGIRHDIKNIITVIDSLIERNDHEAAKDMLRRLSDEINGIGKGEREI